jgi:hypothetical protein
MTDAHAAPRRQQIAIIFRGVVESAPTVNQGSTGNDVTVKQRPATSRTRFRRTTSTRDHGRVGTSRER